MIMKSFITLILASLATAAPAEFTSDVDLNPRDQRLCGIRSTGGLGNNLVRNSGSPSTRDSFSKRSVLSGCSGERAETAQNILAQCAVTAGKAAEAARNGKEAKMLEYFKSATPATRQIVADVYQDISDECGKTNAGFHTFSCTDTDDWCNASGAMAYAEVDSNVTVYCDNYWLEPLISADCDYSDQVGILIHELSHLSVIKGTEDYDGYGYDFVTKNLTAEQNLNHADTYHLFAHDIQNDC